MSKTLSMFVFIIVLGTLTSGLLLGMDLLTRERIEINKEYVWRTTILEHNDISYTTVNFIDFFKGDDPVIRTETKEDPNTGEELSIYINDETGYISFYFKGTGLWGPMEGILTLESDFVTIVDVSVLVETETPGLGGVVSERKHLNQYRGQKFDTFTGGLTGVKNEANSDSEIVIVSGATGTSNAFLLSLNQNHIRYANLFELVEINEDYIWISVILNHNNIVDYTTSNFQTVFNNNFTTSTKQVDGEDLTLYINNDSGSYSFLFEATGFNGPIEGIITLADDFTTIVNITITKQTEIQGAGVSERAFLDQFIDKEFDPDTGLVISGTPTAKNEILILAGATASGAPVTTNGLLDELNSLYRQYAIAFELAGIEEVDVNLWKLVLLDHHLVNYTIDKYNEAFALNFDIETKVDPISNETLTLYINKNTGDMSYFFVGVGHWGDIEGYISIKSDFKTIINITITNHSELWGRSISSRGFLNQFVGMVFDEDEGIDHNGIILISRATNTTVGLIDALNSTRVLYEDLFELGGE